MPDQFHRDYFWHISGVEEIDGEVTRVVQPNLRNACSVV
jgi:hypothetical protein